MDKTVLANRELHIANHAQLYELNIKHIKQTYPNNYFEIDCDKRNREEILEDIARLLKFKIKSKRPKRPASILVLGGDKATRVAICRRIAKRYGFVLVLIRELLSEQIGKNSEVGRLILSNVRNKIDVKDSIINGLVQNRLSQVDVQMQGFIL